MEEILKALADKNRIEILKLLRKKSLSVGEMLENFDITNASLSHHLDILKRVNLVTSKREGQFIYYSLNIAALKKATSEINKTFKI